MEDGVPKAGVNDEVPKDSIVADKENRKGRAKKQRERMGKLRDKREKGKRRNISAI